MSAAFQEGRTALCGHHCQTTVRTSAHFYDIAALECIKFWYKCDYIYYNSVACNAPGGFLSIESQRVRGSCLAGRFQQHSRKVTLPRGVVTDDEC